jgi:hypothetical protein
MAGTGKAKAKADSLEAEEELREEVELREEERHITRACRAFGCSQDSRP